MTLKEATGSDFCLAEQYFPLQKQYGTIAHIFISVSMNTKSLLGWGVVIVGIIALVLGLARLGAGSGTSPTDTRDNPNIIPGSFLESPVDETDHSKGNPDALIELVEYSDFECPFCASAAPMVSRLADEFGDDIKVVYRHFPLRQIHRNAQLAAQATEAAALQGKFWEMHDQIFATQAQWSKNRSTLSFFTNLAESLGLDKKQFEKDLRSTASINAVNEDYISGEQSGVNGTPTFYLNGQKIQTPSSYQSFKNLIQGAIDQLNDTNGESTPTETSSTTNN
jgi:protein-disulfide isomerase